MSWKLVKIGDVCKTGAGGTPLKSKKEFYDGGTIPWLLSGEVSQGEIFSSRKFITEKGLQNSSAKIFPTNTVLVAMYGATAGQVGILRFEASTNQAVCGIYPNDKLLPKFIYYSMLSKQKELIGKAAGNAQPNISQIKVKNTEIPLIDLEEQKRIVAILDEAFAGIDTAIANTEKNLANARELFESYLSAVFTVQGKSWKSKKFSECLRLKSGDGLTSKQMIPGEFSVFGGNGIAGNHNEFNLSGDNVVIGRVGALCGNVRNITENIWLTDNAFKVTQTEQCMDNKFLTYLLNFKNLRKYARQSAQPVISNSSLKDIELNFPESEAEQKSINKKFDELHVEVEQLKSIYQQKLNSLKELKQSLLQKAFSGELTAEADKLMDEAVA
ncbi:MAG: hypothetical protein CMK46_04100 [Porticoccus sp.]|nr:hypothetical protein [Porticoccus sp.]|tara:strand:- start:2292 stop:3446 length:1155 start_codon:yes stop_codon:yes gene_type:complete